MDPQIPMLLRHWMGWLRDVFSPRTQDQMLTLLAGAILTPGCRTVAALMINAWRQS